MVTLPLDKPKKGKKTAAAVTEVHDKKPKRTYKKKTTEKTTEKNIVETTHADTDEDDDLDVDIVVIDGQQFLVDSDKNLYDFATHLPLNRTL